MKRVHTSNLVSRKQGLLASLSSRLAYRISAGSALGELGSSSAPGPSLPRGARQVTGGQVSRNWPRPGRRPFALSPVRSVRAPCGEGRDSARGRVQALFHVQEERRLQTAGRAQAAGRVQEAGAGGGSWYSTWAEFLHSPQLLPSIKFPVHTLPYITTPPPSSPSSFSHGFQPPPLTHHGPQLLLCHR